MKERIQKLLSRAGYGSRREIERWIEAGDILVNGKRAEIGQPIS
ncbi:MAG TPA: S4 domain-containing protein, partial [Thiolinea sp.]|nr:S4 domain-containing protein [Thiolinea sp.]